MATYWASTNSQPKRAHRFLFKFGNVTGQDEGKLPAWVCSRVTRPSMEITTTEAQYMNHTFKYPGRAKWNNISVTLRDPVDPDASVVLYEWLDKCGYKPPIDAPSTKKALTSFTKKSFAEFFGALLIQSLNGEGDVVEEWGIYNPIITSVNWGEFDYSSEDLINITVDIAYDYATIKKVASAA